MSKSLIALIQDEDPSFDPIENARVAAGISADALKTAVNRVWYDGYFGPVSAVEWGIAHDSAPLSVSEAVETLRLVAENVDDYWYDSGDNFGMDLDSMVPSTDIVRAAWPFLIEIYGGLPF